MGSISRRDGASSGLVPGGRMHFLGLGRVSAMDWSAMLFLYPGRNYEMLYAVYSTPAYQAKLWTRAA